MKGRDRWCLNYVGEKDVSFEVLSKVVGLEFVGEACRVTTSLAKVKRY